MARLVMVHVSEVSEATCLAFRMLGAEDESLEYVRGTRKEGPAVLNMLRSYDMILQKKNLAVGSSMSGKRMRSMRRQKGLNQNRLARLQ